MHTVLSPDWHEVIATMSVRLMIVDDHEMVAVALADLLGDHPEFDVVGAAGTVREAIQLAERERPEIVLADQRLPDGQGVELAIALRSRVPGSAVVIVTADPTRDVVDAALSSGCAGVVGKSAPVQELLSALRSAASGGTYFSRDALSQVLSARHIETDADRLSDRERAVLQLVAHGRTTQDIAAELHLSLHTVRNHLRRALARLDVHTKLDAVIVAAGRGEITIDRDPT